MKKRSSLLISIQILGILVFGSVCLVQCYEKEYQVSKNINGDYRCVQTFILLTSFNEEKTDLYNSCIKKVITINNSRFSFDSTCSFFSGINSMTFVDSLVTNQSFDLDNLDRFYANLNTTDEYFKEHMTLRIGKQKDLENNVNEVKIISVSDTLILVAEPYVFVAKKVK